MDRADPRPNSPPSNRCPKGARPQLPWPAAARIAAAHGLGELRDLRPLARGQITPVSLLNGEFVLRLRPADRPPAPFLPEAALYARLPGRLPVPEVVAV